MWISVPPVGQVRGRLREPTEHRENAAGIFSEAEPHRPRVREQRLKAIYLKGSSFLALPLPLPHTSHPRPKI